MDIVSRKENKLLNRIEIKFSWLHAKQATPSRQAVMNLVKTLEPGSKVERIVVKECNTRFGQPLTTGLAFIYGDEESMKVEPEYVHNRFSGLRSSNASADESAAEENTSEDDGGEA